MVEQEKTNRVYREDPPVDIQLAIEPRERKLKKRSVRNG